MDDSTDSRSDNDIMQDTPDIINEDDGYDDANFSVSESEKGSIFVMHNGKLIHKGDFLKFFEKAKGKSKKYQWIDSN